MLNLEKCESLVADINDGVYPITYEDISNHVNMENIQIRHKDNHEHQRYIAEKINDANGSTEKCNPVIVYEGIGKNGSDVRGDGNHTVAGIDMSRHGTVVPVTRIPFPIIGRFTEIELHTLGNLLNKPAEVKKESVSEEDGKRQIYKNIKSGIGISNPINKKVLKTYGFSDYFVDKIIDECQHRLEANDRYMEEGLLFKNYKSNQYKHELTDRVAEHEKKPDTCSVYMSSKKLDIDRILTKLYDIRNDSGTEKAVIVIHHPTVQAEENWRRHICPDWTERLEHFGIPVTFDEMPMWEKE